jgi:carboxyl-terminal processing protease
MPRRSNAFLFVFLFVLLCALLGGLLGPGLTRVSAATGPEDDVQASIHRFTRIYDVVEQNAATKPTADKAIYKGAIPGMLRTLDPHSNFFDPKDFAALRDDQRGEYFGVGMYVGERNGKTIVIAPFEGSPAYKAGLRPGDVIVAVNDKHTDNMTTSEIADMLKGPKGTNVTVIVGREGVDKPITFNITRGEIPRNSVEKAFWLKPGIAYMKITSFNETTSKEMDENLSRLGEENMRGLVLDLRDNPGGLLNEGVKVAGHWLRKGEIVVSHRGRASADKPYTATGSPQGLHYPMIVVVNGYSASAAEIVSGALQDHDRALIVGDTTFGKGLVQTVYPLDDNTGLALTTAHYYTPSGRLIQRDYTNISFLDYYYGKHAEQKNPLDVKMTDAGRTVYGGGGITPDEKIPTPKLNKFQTEVLRAYAFFNFTADYFGSHSTKLPAGWSPDLNVVEQFHDYLLKKKVSFTEADWAENHTWVQQQLKREMYITAFSFESAQKVQAENDPVLGKAVSYLPEAVALLDKSNKLVVQRTSRDHF